MFDRPPHTSDSARDAALVERTLAGDRSAFEALVLLHTPRLRAIARNLVLEHAAVEDVVQEAFLKAYDRLGQLSDIDHFAGWLAIICRNEGVTWLRRTSRLHPVANLPEPTAPESEDSEHPQLRPLQIALPKLSPSFREILALKYEAGLDYEAIAQTLGLSLANVEKRLYRARQALVALMAQVPKDLDDEAVVIEDLDGDLPPPAVEGFKRR